MRALILVVALQFVVAVHEARAGFADHEAVLPPEGELAAGLVQPPLVGGVEFVVGNALWQPGKRYRNAADWLALSCTRAGCSFEAAKLRVKPEKWQGHYDDQATAGQHLTFSKSTPSPAGAKVIGWFRPHAKHAWLKPGPVTTYASTAAHRKRPPTRGTLEAAVDLPDGTQAVFVPLLDRAQSVFRLQLRAHGRRQLLGQLGACSGMVVANYLLWAGDLDEDGRPDYLVSFVDADGQTRLYLSGASAAHELAGVAGIHDAPPYGGECDGGGWIDR